MDYMIIDSTGNALGAYEDEIEAHAALRQIAETEPAAADVALLSYVNGVAVGEAMTPANLPVASYSVEPSGWTFAIGMTRAVTAWDDASLFCAFNLRSALQVPNSAGVAAAPDWEQRLAKQAA